MEHTVLLTGATGFLSTEIAAQLLTTTQSTIFALVRAANEAAAVSRLKAVWWEEPALVKAIGGRVIPLCGDITQPDLGLSRDSREGLSAVTAIIHAAAETGIQNTRETLHPQALPENLYVADASLFPESMGNPPMLTIMALSKAIAGRIKSRIE